MRDAAFQYSLSACSVIGSSKSGNILIDFFSYVFSGVVSLLLALMTSTLVLSLFALTASKSILSSIGVSSLPVACKKDSASAA